MAPRDSSALVSLSCAEPLSLEDDLGTKSLRSANSDSQCISVVIADSKTLWEVDLSHFGYQGRPPSALAHVSLASAYKYRWAYQQGVVFTADPNVVVAYFVVRDSPAGVSEPHEPTTSDSFRLVAVFLNTKDGTSIKQLDCILPPDPNQVSSSFFYLAGQATA